MNNILENSISNIDDDLIEMTAQKLTRKPRRTALNIAKFAGIAAAAAALCIAVPFGIKQYGKWTQTHPDNHSSTVDPVQSGAGNAVVMPLEDLVKLSDEQAEKLLLGLTYDELVIAWGKPSPTPWSSLGLGAGRFWQCGDMLVALTFDEYKSGPIAAMKVIGTKIYSMKTYSKTSSLDFKARIFTGGINSDNYQETIWINDRTELEKYFSEYDDISRYDDVFFQDRTLLYISIQESSGDYEYNVENVEYIQDGNTVIPVIERTGLGLTEDVGYWRILIELDKSVSGSSVSLNIKKTNTRSLDFKAQYIRTSAPDDDLFDPKTTLIKSRAELDKYIADNSDKYDLGHMWESRNTFVHAVSGYDDEFFQSRCLLLTTHYENSGSNELNVKKVEYAPTEDGGTVTATIERIVPQMGDCDEAYRHILIELDNSVSDAKFIVNYEHVDQKSELDFKAKYVRTNASYPYEDSFPKTVWIKSKAELEKYYADNSDKYNFKYDGDDFYSAVSGYNDEFFEKHSLLFVVLQEGSGSVTHNVKKVEYSLENDGTVFPTIERMIPFSGDDDMAHWHIMIELDKYYDDAAVKVDTIKVTTVHDPKPDFYFGEKDYDYAHILKHGYENDLGFKVKNMEHRPDFIKYSVGLLYPDSDREAADSITYVFSNYSITASRYDENIHHGFLDRSVLEKYDYKGTTFCKNPEYPDYIILFDENDIEYHCLLDNPDEANAVRDLIIEIISAK